jgi:hypothetical protein
MNTVEEHGAATNLGSHPHPLRHEQIIRVARDLLPRRPEGTSRLKRPHRTACTGLTKLPVVVGHLLHLEDGTDVLLRNVGSFSAIIHRYIPETRLQSYNHLFHTSGH